MKLFIEQSNGHSEITFKGTVTQLLKSLKINPATVIVIKNGKLVDGHEMIYDSDSVKVLEVFMGG